MPKVLKPYTIIPPELYVLRDADKQVRNIINDMGRPGYVLVSRQMGKTNLLLNAKRTLETEKDIFVYIDLSNPFPDSKSCFENIINVAIESYPNKFQEISNLIYDRRKELKDTPPHKQHTNELRLLLGALKGGKLIIILDEIDALIKTNYSDQIFSQIRSSYFASRVNFQEFNNLTYLLSGVIEPTEIIKDPKVSPFNIGQKIYLNDFSKNEFEKFIYAAKLNLSDEIKNRIFYWTNGNPRMTWDVCSEVENRMKSSLNTEIIDKIVTDLYLTTFDKPPIDNIREIVQKDREIRNSIIEIEYKKGKEISDRIKSKLYLAGIINFEDDDIHIKNEIIRRSLSYEWVRKLEEEEEGLLNLAIREYRNFNYLEALNTFENFLSANKFESTPDNSPTFFLMGHCAFLLRKFDKAFEYFSMTNYNAEEEALSYYKTLSYKGLTYYYLDKPQQSLDCFREVISKWKKDGIYAQALLNYGGISLKTNQDKNKNEAEKIFREIINESGFNKESISESLIRELKSIAYFNLAQLYALKKETRNAIDNFRMAISLAQSNTKPRIILELIKIYTDENERNLLLKEIFDLLSSKKIKPQEENPDKTMDFNFEDLKNIFIQVFLSIDKSIQSEFLPYLSLLGEYSKSWHLYRLALFSINENQDWQSAILLLNRGYEYIDDVIADTEKEIKYKILKLLAFFGDAKKNMDRHSEYISLFGDARYENVDNMDLEIFAAAIFSLTEQKKYDVALKYINIIKSVKENTAESLLRDYLVIYHLELNIFIYLNNIERARESAKSIIQYANDEKIVNQKSTLVNESGLDIIKQNAEQVLTPSPPKQKPIINTNLYRRNDIVTVRYKDGNVLETKYKKIESDLKNGNCILLEKQ